jgi:hypothetical protein
MAKKSEQNPFVVGLLAQGRRFANRESEVERMEQALSEPGSRLIVYGDRRLGKSSALDRAAEFVRKRGTPAIVASLATASDPGEAAQRVLSALQKEIGRNWRDLMDQIANSLKIGFEVDPSPMQIGGLPTMRLSLGLQKPDSATRLLPDVLSAINEQMEKRGETMGIGLDEFQRIHEWGGEDAEWALRDALQKHAAIGYVLAGSKRSLIEAMVTDKGRAFWKIADTLPFGPMDRDVLVKWIIAEAKRTVVRIPPVAANRIISLTHPRTRDVVQLARAVWFESRARGEEFDADGVDGAFDRLVLDQGELYRVLWANLDVREQSVLRAFAADPSVQITAAETARRFTLGPKSSVHNAVERLVQTEYLTRLNGGQYAFDDPFFRRWVQQFGLPDIGMKTPSLAEWM